MENHPESPDLENSPKVDSPKLDNTPESKIPTNEEAVNELTSDFDSATLSSPPLDSDSEAEFHDAPENPESPETHEDDWIDEDYLSTIEETFTPEEKETRKLESISKKDSANAIFKTGDHLAACQLYTEALQMCPLIFPKERAILYSNRAAAKIKLGRQKSALEDCDRAVTLDPDYVRAFVRRATLKEELDKLDEALADWNSLLEKYPEHPEARAAVVRLPPKIEERNEKLKTEMMGKLKDLGNMILRPFGMSTENFKMVPGEGGGYSIQFQQ